MGFVKSLEVTQYTDKRNKCNVDNGDRGNTVFKVLCYKSEGRWFDPSWCHWIFH